MARFKRAHHCPADNGSRGPCRIKKKTANRPRYCMRHQMLCPWHPHIFHMKRERCRACKRVAQMATARNKQRNKAMHSNKTRRVGPMKKK